MQEDIREKSIRERIIQEVKKGEIKMRPKWYFVLRAVLWMVGLVIVLLTMVYLMSLFLFITSKTGIWMAPAFGMHGVFVFIISLPWMLILLLTVFAAVLELLVRHYAFAWHRPLVYSALGVLLVVGLGGLLVTGTGMHEAFSKCPEHGGPFPCQAGFYRDLGPQTQRNIHQGTVVEIEAPDFVIENFRQDRLFIVVTPQTRFLTGGGFMVGDMVVVIGDRQGDKVRAFGVTKLDK